jgi:hypothetical protein
MPVVACRVKNRLKAIFGDYNAQSPTGSWYMKTTKAAKARKGRESDMQ